MRFLEFKKRFPRADTSTFQEEVEFDSNRKATATVLFTESDGSQTDPLIKDRKYWSQALKRRFGNAPRWWVSGSAVSVYRKQTPASSIG